MDGGGGEKKGLRGRGEKGLSGEGRDRGRMDGGGLERRRCEDRIG